MGGKAATNVMETSMSYSDDDETPQLPAHIPKINEPFTILQNGNVVTPMDEDETCSKEANNTPSMFSSSVGSFNRNLGFHQSDKHTSPVTSASSIEKDSNSNKDEKSKTSKQPVMKNETPREIPSSNIATNKKLSENKQDIVTFILLLLLVGGIYYFIVEMNFKPLNSQIKNLEQELNRQSDIIRQLVTINEKHRMESLEQKNLFTGLEVELKFTTEELAAVKTELLRQGHLIEQVSKERKLSRSPLINNQDSNPEKLPNYSPSSNENYAVSVRHFRQSIKSLMKSSFSSQPRETLIQIVAAVLSTMSEENPMRPSALLILSPSGMDPDFGICFARKLGEIINEAFHAMNKFGDESNKVKEIDSNYFTQMPSLTDVHDDLKNYLNFEGKSVIVRNLNEIQQEDELLVFHAFCDNSNGMAYDTRANFIFTLNVPHSVHKDYDWSHWSGPQIARQALNNAWKNSISADKRAPLISRVASNVILLKEGDSCS